MSTTPAKLRFGVPRGLNRDRGLLGKCVRGLLGLLLGLLGLPLGLFRGDQLPRLCSLQFRAEYWLLARAASWSRRRPIMLSMTEESSLMLASFLSLSAYF